MLISLRQKMSNIQNWEILYIRFDPPNVIYPGGRGYFSMSRRFGLKMDIDFESKWQRTANENAAGVRRIWRRFRSLM